MKKKIKTIDITDIIPTTAPSTAIIIIVLKLIAVYDEDDIELRVVFPSVIFFPLLIVELSPVML